MQRIVLTLWCLLCCTTLYGQEIVRHTYHYATHCGEELYLDRYVAEEQCDTPRPCMIFAFGGGFVQGSRDVDYYRIFFEHLAREGIVVVSIDYRLGLKNLPKIDSARAMIDIFDNAITIAVQDMYCATNFVYANAKEWCVDPTKIMLSGSSAGAITALQAEWLRSNDDSLAEVLPEGFRYAGVVSCAGAIFSRHGRPKFATSPAPMLLFHGTSDSNVPYDHASLFGVGFYGSEYITRQLDKLNSPYWFYSVEYADHRLAGTPLFEQCDLIVQFIREFVIAGRREQTTTSVITLDGERRPTRFSAMDYIRTNYQRDRGNAKP